MDRGTCIPSTEPMDFIKITGDNSQEIYTLLRAKDLPLECLPDGSWVVGMSMSMAYKGQYLVLEGQYVHVLSEEAFRAGYQVCSN